MKKITKVFALLLVLSLVITAFAGCKVKKTDNTDDYIGGDTLVVGYSRFSGKFSPFFATTAYDQDVVGMTTVGLISTDREGNVVYKGIEGEKRTYNGTEYTYTGLTDVTETINDDGTVDYDIKLRKGVKFSDGKELTAKDVLFSIYVYCDPTYTGSTTFSALPIVGMEDYQKNMSTKASLIFAAKPDNTDYSLFTKEDADTYWAAFDAAGVKYAQSIIDYCVNNYLAYSEAYIGKTADEVTANDSLKVVLGMGLWGFGKANKVNALDENGEPIPVLDENGEPAVDAEGNPKYQKVFDGTFTSAVSEKTFDLNKGEYPDAAFYWGEILGAYGYDYEGLNKEKADDTLDVYVDNELTALGKGDEYARGIKTGDANLNIEGIKMVNDYEVTIKMTEFDATAIYHIGVYVAPMHYYGDESKWDPDNGSFGFTKGDLAGVKSKTSAPMGAGPYMFKEFKDGVVLFERNTNYFDGSPKIKYIKFQETDDADKVPGVTSGSFDVTDPSFTTAAVESIKKANSNGEITGNVVTTSTVDNLGYGYIGANATNVSVGGEPASEASKNLRKGFATLFAANREKNILSYYGERASIIQYPISNTSWAAPKPNDQGYAIAYSKDVNGNPIYTDDMTYDQRCAAALDAAIEFFKAAGYTWDDSAKKFVEAPRGARLEYEVIVPGDGKGDHPAYGILTDVKDQLATIGITLNINDPSDSDVLWDALDAGTQDFWTAAWGAAVDPDMYQVYHSSNVVGLPGSSESNHYRIQDDQLDKLIMDARKSADHNYRKGVYKECLDIIMDWGVEIPTYQRQNAIIFSTERVNMSTVTPDITTFWGWMNDIQLLEMNPVQ